MHGIRRSIFIFIHGPKSCLFPPGSYICRTFACEFGIKQLVPEPCLRFSEMPLVVRRAYGRSIITSIPNTHLSAQDRGRLNHVQCCPLHQAQKSGRDKTHICSSMGDQAAIATQIDDTKHWYVLLRNKSPPAVVDSRIVPAAKHSATEQDVTTIDLVPSCLQSNPIPHLSRSGREDGVVL